MYQGKWLFENGMKKERRINRIDSRCSSVDRTLGLGPRSRTFEPYHLDLDK